MNNPNYIIITPVRDEADYISKTIHSVVCQTIRPNQWIIVNDGSKDATGCLVNKAAADHEWIHVAHRHDRGFRKSGGGVVEAFYDGYKEIKDICWDFLVKLDGDLEFNSDYFEGCFRKFDENEKLGIGGGSVYCWNNGELVEECSSDAAFHVRGACKIYRAACWRDIGELIPSPGWDTFDEIKANMLGWTTDRFKDLRVIENKPTGSADGAWKTSIKDGRANYIVGYHPLFMLLKCLRRMFHHYYGLEALGLSYGFISGYLKGVPQIKDRQLINYLRQQQIRRLLYRNSLWN